MTTSYRPDIDGLRAVAVLAVVAFHAFPHALPGGFVGVDIFFVISGYLITRDILARQTEGRFSIVGFYARRVRRIFPALITVLVATIVVGWLLLFPREFDQLLAHVASSAAFVQNFRLLSEAGYFDTSAQFKPLLHLWSLAIEEQFYLVWPLALMWLRRPLPMALVAVASSFVANLWFTGVDPSQAYYLPFTRFWQIAAGAVLAMHTVRLEGRAPDLLALLGAILIVGAALLLSPAEPYPGWPGLAPTLGAVALVGAGPSSILARCLAWRPAVFVGRISYPLYLWHWPLLAYLRILDSVPSAEATWLVLLVAFLLSAGTYFCIEQPLRHANRATAKARGLAGTMVLLAALCAGQAPLLAGLPRDSSANERQLALIDDLQPPALGMFAACGGRMLDVAQGLSYCLQSGKPDTALVGDSHAVHLFRALVETDPRHGWLLATRSSCPPLSNVHVTAPGIDCGRHMDDALALIAADPNIQSVILSFYGGYAHTTDLAFDHVQNKGGASKFKLERPGAADKPAAMRAGLQDTVRQLRRADKTVVIALDVPELPFSPRECATRRVATWIKPCRVSRAPATERQAVVREAALALQAEDPKVRVFDPMPILCDETWCAVERGGLLAYYDSHHLSLRGSRLIAKPLIDSFRPSSAEAASVR